MDRYELMWKITQKYGYIYDLRKIGNHKAKEVCEFGCPIHGWVTKIVDNLLHKKTVNGIGCPKCAAEVNKLSWDEFLIKANKLYGNKFMFYKPKDKFNEKSYIDYECIDCGRKGHNRINVILNPKTKIKCCDYIPYNKLNENEIKLKISEIYNNKYDLSYFVYKGINYPSTLICPIHGKFISYVSSILNGCGCDKCRNERISKEKMKSHEQYILDCEKVHGKGRYIYLTEYKGEKNNITFQCTKCGRISTKNASHHLHRMDGCSFCSKSHLEQIVQIFLENNNIKFTPQFKIANRQSLDFYLDEYNIAIECQGEQHFSNNFHKSNDSSYVKRDINKYYYCIENNINLVYFTNKKLVKKYDILENEKYESLYRKDNTFFEIDDLLNKIRPISI